MKIDKILFRIIKDKLFMGSAALFSVLSIVPLLFILLYIITNGIGVINWQFLTELPMPVGEIGGGIANALVGTGILILVACLFSIPLGVAAGIHLAEQKTGRLAYGVRLSAEVLQGIPSIVIGIIAYVWLVVPMGTFSALSGGIALGIIMLPVIVRTTEETLKLIPETLREASLALGVPYYRTMLKVVLPAGLSGILTGILLSIARIAGETAPLLFTAFGSPFMDMNILKPVNSMPLLIFNYATSPYPEWHALAWGASFVLVVFVLVLNMIAKVISRK
jgi:phosphate transport system permease protein